MVKSAGDSSNRVLPSEPYGSIAEYVAAGGGKGLAAARAVDAETVIGELTASGLRGRGGAGFPTGVKWRTIKSFASPLLATSVVVNAAEGEPGTFKDRTIIRANPYAVIEGALIAAWAMEAKSVVIATKAAFGEEIARLQSAIAEVGSAGWSGDVEIRVADGPAEYLFGEETALLEVLDGRPPFPRIAPPFRQGIVEVVDADRRRFRERASRRRADGRNGRKQRGSAGAGEQRRDDGQRARDHRSRLGLVPIGGHHRVTRNDRVHRHRGRAAPRRGRGADGHAGFENAIDLAGGGLQPGPDGQRRAGRGVQCCADRRPPRHRTEL